MCTWFAAAVGNSASAANHFKHSRYQHQPRSKASNPQVMPFSSFSPILFYFLLFSCSLSFFLLSSPIFIFFFSHLHLLPLLLSSLSSRLLLLPSPILPSAPRMPVVGFDAVRLHAEASALPLRPVPALRCLLTRAHKAVDPNEAIGPTVTNGDQPRGVDKTETRPKSNA